MSNESSWAKTVSEGLQTEAPVARWEHFPHGADIGVRGFGPTMAAAFEQAALAMTAVMTDPELVSSDNAIAIKAEAPNAEILLVDWLNELVLAMASRGMIFGSFHVTISGSRLEGTACGEPVVRERHAPAVEIKGATMTELRVCEDKPGLWRAQCVVDV